MQEFTATLIVTKSMLSKSLEYKVKYHISITYLTLSID